jgi:hypothetical protein
MADCLQWVVDNGVPGGGGGSAINYKGTWNAATNTPTLGDGGAGGVKGDMYIVSVAGSTMLDGISTWDVGDQVVHSGTVWEKVPNSSGDVLSVNGKVGHVVIDATDVGLGNVTNESKAVMFNNPTFTGIVRMDNVVMGVRHYTDADGSVHILASDGKSFNTVTHAGASTVLLPISPDDGTEYRVLNYGTGTVAISAQPPNHLDTLGEAATVQLTNYLDKVTLVYINNVWNIMM